MNIELRFLYMPNILKRLILNQNNTQDYMLPKYRLMLHKSLHLNQYRQYMHMW